jgi:hypothetical protein
LIRWFCRESSGRIPERIRNKFVITRGGKGEGQIFQDHDRDAFTTLPG